MGSVFKSICLSLLVTLIAGCKLAIITVEGGEVQSEGSGACTAGSICIIDITDSEFSETFTAIPDTGWYFQKWNAGHGFFCGGSLDPTCALSFAGHEQSEQVASMVASDEVFYLMPVFKMARLITDTITVDGKEWGQVDLFKGLQWNEINAVCQEGICSGVLNGYYMDGWTWASVDDVNALFNRYIGEDEMGPGPDVFYDTTWAVTFFNDGWRPTSLDLAGWERAIDGWAHDMTGQGLESYGRILDGEKEVDDGWEEYPGEMAETASYTADPNREIGEDLPSVGGWFYRNP